jgi:4-hydroxyproline epimerase
MTVGLSWPERIEVVDSHTEGEPTRVVVEGWPQPEGRTMAERRSFLLTRQDPCARPSSASHADTTRSSGPC